MGQPLILLVEGNPDIRRLVEEVLGDEYRVMPAGSAADAMGILNQSPPDAAVLDCVLPGGGVETVLRQAKAAGVPVLLTSGHPGMIATYANRDHAFLAKPYRLRELLESLAGLLGARRHGAGIPHG